jgi:hypothetical protein
MTHGYAWAASLDGATAKSVDLHWEAHHPAPVIFGCASPQSWLEAVGPDVNNNQTQLAHDSVSVDSLYDDPEQQLKARGAS